MRGMDIFQKPYYREISTMRGRPMRGPPVLDNVGMYTFKAKFPCLICCYGLTTFSSVFIGTSKKFIKDSRQKC